MSKRARPTPEEAPRGGRARAVSELLPAVGGTAFRKFGFVQSAVVSRWAEIVGPRWARVSTPESIRFAPGEKRDGVLTLTVHGAHGPMMQHITPEIVERVNRFFGYAAIARVTIRQGEARTRELRPVTPAPGPLPAELGDSLRAIADPELKAVLSALAAGVASSSGPPKIS